MTAEEIPKFVDGATNVYRTKGYIVNQVLSFEEDENGNGFVFSRDIYYRRTPVRDRQFERWFSERQYTDGTRFPCQAYSRRYVG